MHKRFLVTGALLAGTGVALGAFGAHGLEKMTSDARILHGFQTGVLYQLLHALALLFLALAAGKITHHRINWAGNLFTAGVVLFSGSLYLLTFLKIQGSTAVRFIGPVTPLGGVCFIAGWLALVIAAVSLRKD